MSSNRWTILGPTGVLDGQMHLPSTPDGPTIAGRVTCVERAGTVLFVGTAGGGLWVSTDEGLNWRPLTDRIGCLSIGALAFDAPRSMLWVGSGEGNEAGRAMFGQGLYRLDAATLDAPAGPNVLRFTNLPAPHGANFFRTLRSVDILLEPQGNNPPIVWWGTNNGLFRSTDSGGSWTEVSFNGASSNTVSSMVLCTSQGSARMLVALWNEQLFLRRTGSPTVFDALTTNLGALPAGASIGTRIGLAVAPSDPERVYLALGKALGAWDGIYRSDLGGNGWTKVGFPSPTHPARPLGQSHYNLLLEVFPTDPDVVYFGETGIWRSLDAGATWQDLASNEPGTHSDQHALCFDAADPQRVWLGNDGGVWLSTNGGGTWASRNRGLANLQYYALVHHPQAPSVLLAGAQDNGTQRYAGHPGWNLIGGGDGFYCGIDPFDPRYWYSSYVYRDSAGKIAAFQRSDAAGRRWRTRTDGIDPTEYASGEPFYVPFVCDPITPQVLYLGTTRLWRTADRGDSWLAVRQSDGTLFSTAATGAAPSSGNSITCIAIDPNDGNTVYVGTADGKLFRLHIDAVDASGQATATVTEARSSGAAPVPPRSAFTDLAVPTLPGGSPLAPVYAVQGSDYLTFINSQLTAQSVGRIWKHDFTAGAAVDWTALGTALPSVALPSGPALSFDWNFVNAIAIDPNAPQRLFVGCHMGVFESADGGATWQPTFTDDLPLAPVVDLQFHPQHRLLRAATMGRSVWERPVDPVPAPETAADIYIRDNVIDIGRFDTAASGTDPLTVGGTLEWFEAVDLKVDTKGFFGGFDPPPGTIDYTPDGALDYVGFQKLGTHALQREIESKIHLQVLNRGPAAATNVKARVYWALQLPDNAFPALPAAFWASFPDGALPAASPWKPAAVAQTVASLRAGEPHVFSFDFTSPAEEQAVGLFAVITCDEDPIAEARTDVQLVATTNKRTALRRVELNASTGSIVLGVLAAIGAAVVVGAAIASSA